MTQLKYNLEKTGICVNITAIIPARYASSRFPGKLLARETGKYLIEHVYEQVSKASLINNIMIAADDKRIGQACDEFGGRWIMTRADHQCGTDRIAEAAQELEAEIIINVQGDEPEIDPAAVDKLTQLLLDDKEAQMATLAAVITEKTEIDNPNVVKVVTDKKNRALYFSRRPIPYNRDNTTAAGVYRKHLGIYAYRREMLLKFSALEQTPLEQMEKLEQLRALENGINISVADVDHPAVGIDTPQQYAEFVQRVRRRIK